MVETGDDERLFDEVSAKVQRHLKKAKVSTLILVMTDLCNLCCGYCFENLLRFSKRRSLDLSKMLEAVDYFMALDGGEKSIFFYGGEPLIEWDKITRCVRYIRDRYGKRKISIQITTNGTLRPAGLIEFCKENGITIGVSIDGPSEITNAARVPRKPNIDVFKQSFGLINECRRAGVEYAALCTVTRESAPHLEQITDFFVREDIRGIGFNLSIRQAGESIEEELSFWDDLGRKMSAQYRRLLARGILEPRGLRYLRGIAESRFVIAECDAGYRGQMVVSADGLIGPCQAFLHNTDFWIPIDSEMNIQDNPLWSSFSRETTLEIASCRSCPFMGTCGGGCRYNRNDFGRPNPNFCQYIRSFIYHTLTSFGAKQEV
ncbi:MAG: radical SAM protein [Minisyncoccia bacterium]|jgi:uncharacterized protein